MHSYELAKARNWWRHEYHDSGKPWIMTISGPFPARATRIRRPLGRVSFSKCQGSDICPALDRDSTWTDLGVNIMNPIKLQNRKWELGVCGFGLQQSKPKRLPRNLGKAGPTSALRPTRSPAILRLVVRLGNHPE